MTWTYPHPRPSVTVDIAVLRRGTAGIEVLLIRRAHEPFLGCWALPGGFVDEGEDLPEAAARELFEETGIRGVRLRQVGTYGAPGRDPRGWTVSVVYMVKLDPEREVTAHAGDDAAQVGWFPVDSPPALAFDHDVILADVLVSAQG